MTDSANLELVRSIYAKWERGDYASTDWARPDIEYVMADGPSPGSWTGVADMAAQWGDWVNAWQDFRTEADEYRAIDDQRVVVFVRWSGRGKTSGVEIGQMRTEGANLFHVRAGQVARLAFYLDRKHALADLGLED